MSRLRGVGARLLTVLLAIVLPVTVGWIVYCAHKVWTTDGSAGVMVGAISAVGAAVALALPGFEKSEDPRSWVRLVVPLAAWGGRDPGRSCGLLLGCLVAAVLAYNFGPRKTYAFRVLCNAATAIQSEYGSMPCNASTLIRPWSPWSPLRPDTYDCVWSTVVPNRKEIATLDVTKGTLTCPPEPPPSITNVERAAPREAPLPGPAPGRLVVGLRPGRKVSPPMVTTAAPLPPPDPACARIAGDLSRLQADLAGMRACTLDSMPDDLEKCKSGRQRLEDQIAGAKRKKEQCP